MNKKCLLIFIILIFSYLYSNSSGFIEPKLSLTGHIPIENNTPKYYNNPDGLTILGSFYYFLPSMNQEIEHTVDTEKKRIILSIKNGKYELTNPIYISYDQYMDKIFGAVFEKEMLELKYNNFSDTERDAQAGLIPDIIIKLPPMAMPRTVRKIMGSQAGRLNLSGSQKITVSASRTKRDTKQLSEYTDSANFDLTMKQDLNLNLEGTIGEKINVNIKYNSDQETNILDPNNINISYTGDEDEIVQSIEAGNTSLSITGSKYISVSASSQGLFGIKSILKIGDLSLTAIASKEEAQKNSQSFKGSAQADSTVIKSKDFSKRSFFYSVNPNEVFSLYTQSDAESGLCPQGWVDNAIKTDPMGAWYIENPGILPQDGTVQLFIDDDNANNNNVAIPGKIIDENGNLSTMEYFFDAKIEGTDYVVDYDTGLISIYENIERKYTVAIAYINRNGTRIGNAEGTEITLKPLKIKNHESTSYTWKYEARNIYNLNMKNVKNDGFLLEVYTESSTRERIYTVPDSIQGASGMTYNDYLKLDTNDDGRINGDDATVNLSSGLVIIPFINPFLGLNDELMYYQDTVTNDQFMHYLFIKGQIGRDQVNLGMMILPGSVTVKINNKTLTENVDYLVDYDFGTVTFLTPEGKDPDADIQIDYENKPIFSIESKTLFGFRADWTRSDYLRLGGTFIYHSEKISDKRPKIGNESRSLILANVDGELKVKPPFMTKAIDLIPFIQTDEESSISLSGEIALNSPHIHGSDTFGHGDEAWLDDMESILDSYPLGIMRTNWVPASNPFMTNFVRGRVNWFNPNNVYYKDVFDPITLSEKEGNEKLSVLSLKISPPEIHIPGISAPIWGGLQRYIGNQVDFSDKEYIEFLVKVDSLNAGSQVRMYLDMGDISEDFYTYNGGRGILNTEDGCNGGDLNGQLEYMEDIGLDNIPREEQGYDPFDYFSNDEIDNEFPHINGTEGNGRLDTEDLNGNGMLDITERFFRFQVPLNDQQSPYFLSEFNGWHLYRVPLKNNPQLLELSNVSNSYANLSKISYVKVWFETEDKAKINLVYLDVIGNKWQKMAIKEREDLTESLISEITLDSNDEYLSIETIDNQKSTHYTAPPKTTEKGKDGEISFEQALEINYNNIQAGHISLARQRFNEQYNLLSYNKLRYWIYTEKENNLFNADSLNIIFRIGADSLNYYEIQKKVKVNDFEQKMNLSYWQEIEINYTDITTLKSINADNDTLYIKDNITYRKIRKPTMSNIREIAIGIQVPENENTFNGTIYFNDIRVAEPNQNIGYAARTTLDVKFADFSNLKLDYEWKTSDFYTSTSRNMTSATNLEDKVIFNISNSYSLHKFFPINWGLRFPLNMSKNHSIGIPKYKSNSDILRESLSVEEKEKEKNISDTRQADTSLSMTKTPSNKFVAYTLKNMSIGATIKETQTNSATKADTTISWKYNGSYNLSLPENNIKLKLFGDYYWFFAPKSFSNSATLRGEFPKRWDWNTTDDIWKPRAQTINTKNLETSNEIKYDIFSDMNTSWKLSTKRDLMSEKRIKNINIGQETERNQDIQYGYTPFYTTALANVQLTASAIYRENRRQITQNNNEGVQETVNRYEGNVNRNIKTTITIKNSDWFSSLANWINKESGKQYTANQRESGVGFDDKTTNDKTIEDKKDFDDKTFNETTLDYDKKEYEDSYLSKEKELEYQKDNEADKNIKNEKTKTDTLSINKPIRPAFNKAIVADFFGFLARLQNFNVSYENLYGTRFDQRENRPKFLYQLGIPHILSNEEIRQKNNNDSYSVSTGFPLMRNITTDWRYSYQIQRTYASATNQSITTVWPDVKVSLINFERLIRVEKWLSSSRISTSYSYTERLTGDVDWETPKTKAITHSFNPLLGWTGNWTNDVSSSLSVTKNTTENITYQSGFDIIRDSNKMTYSGSVSYSFSADQGIKLPFMKKKLYFKNQMQSELQVNYETETSSTQGRDSKQIDRDTNKFTITPRASYNFHRNVKGGLSGTFDITNNKKTDEKINIFTLDIWIEIIF